MEVLELKDNGLLATISRKVGTLTMAYPHKQNRFLAVVFCEIYISAEYVLIIGSMEALLKCFTTANLQIVPDLGTMKEAAVQGK